MPELVVIGLLGTEKDSGTGAARWKKWRPSVGLCQQANLGVKRFELLHEPEFEALARRVRQDIQEVSPGTEVQLMPVTFDDPWSFGHVYSALDDFARDYPFDLDKEEYLIHVNTGTHVARICMFLLTESHHLPGKLIQSVPPGRGKKQATGTHRIIDLDLSTYDLIASRFRREQEDAVSILNSGIKTRNRDFNRLIGRIEHVAVGPPMALLLTGPTGAGKSRLARQIYELKKARSRVKGEFVEVNCATIRGDTAMSTLFGHVKGAFTGAAQARRGLLRTAHEGILFLDEIGELGQDEQGVLLHALEERVFFPVGSDREVASDFQLIAGTNRDLAADARAGRFREDLLARIDVWTFRLPGLRDRPEDIEPNIEYELERVSQQIGATARFNKEARRLFLRFAQSPEALWRRSFRDLNGAVVRMCTLARDGRITVEIVEEEVKRLRNAWKVTEDRPVGTLVESTLGPDRAGTLDRFDRAQLEEVLLVCSKARTLSEAGRILFASSRERKSSSNDAHRIRKYLSRFGVEWRDIVGQPSLSWR